METSLQPSIQVRDIDPEFKDAKRHWFGDSPYFSHLVHALSFQFPAGEAMFVKSVLAFRDRIKDPVLRKAVKAFVAQESLHSKYHEEFNAWVESCVPEAKQYRAAVTKQIDEAYDRMAAEDPMINLANTVALEHMTAIMARAVLRNREIIERMDPKVRPLLVWHAIEEIEHRSVAFDVYRHVGGSYRLRIWVMLFSTFHLALTTSRYHVKLLFRDGELFNVKALFHYIYENIKPGGFFRSLVGAYLDFFRKDFHPLQHQDDDLIAEWSKELEALVPVKVMGRFEPKVS